MSAGPGCSCPDALGRGSFTVQNPQEAGFLEGQEGALTWEGQGQLLPIPRGMPVPGLGGTWGGRRHTPGQSQSLGRSAHAWRLRQHVTVTSGRAGRSYQKPRDQGDP